MVSIPPPCRHRGLKTLGVKNQSRIADTQPAPESTLRFDPGDDHANGGEKSWALAFAAFSLCFVLFLWPLFSGRGEPRWDACRQFYPAFAYQADAYAEGRFPLWDPYTNCGYPFHAEPQFSTLSTPAIAIGSLFRDSGTAFVIYYGFLWWIAGMGTIWTTKALGMHPAGGFVAALTFAFSGFFLAHAQHTPYICVAAWLPWVFGLATKSVSDSNRGYALLSGAALGLSSLGGYPILVFFTGFALALWLPLWFLPGTKPGGDERTRLDLLKSIAGTLFIVAAVAILVFSPVLHAFFTEGRGYTDRVAPLSMVEANYGNPLSFPALISLMFPYMTILRPDLLGGGGDMSMTNVYIGAFGMPLGVYWFLGTNRKKRWGFLLFVVLMFLTSLGGKAALRTLLYYLLPPMRFFRFSAPFRLYWIFPMALATGFGFSRLIRHPEERGKVAIIVSGWFLAVIGVTALYLLLLLIRLDYHGLDAEHLPVRLFLPAALALPTFLLVFSIWKNPKTYRGSRILLLVLLGVIAGDFWGHVRNNSYTIWGTEPDSIRKAEALHKRDTTISGEPGGRLPPPPRRWYMNAQQVTKVPAVAGYVTMKSKGFDEVLCRSEFVEVLMSPIRFWLSSGTEPSPSEEKTLKVLSGIGAGVPVPVFVNEVPNVHSGERTVPGALGKVAVRLYSPEQVVLDVEVPGTGNAVLASTERYAAGWEARVDDVPAEVFRVNLYFRGIFVAPGKHTITWRYNPSLWRSLVGLSLASLLVSLAGGIFLSIRRMGKVQLQAGR